MMNTMKRRLLLVAWLVAVTGVCLAQNGVTQNSKPVVPRGSIVLADMKAHHPVMFSQYQSAKKKQRNGTIWTGIGGGFVLAGAVFAIIPDGKDGSYSMGPYVFVNEGEVDNSGLRTAGAVMMVAGGVCLAVSIPVMISGGKKKKQTFQDFRNQYFLSGQPAPYFQMNIYPNRVGVAYVF